MEPSIFDTTVVSLRQAVNPFILLVILFLVFVIIANPIRKSFPGKFLLAILMCYGLMSFNSMLMSFGLKSVFINLLFLYFPIILLIAPLCYLYIKSVTFEKFKLERREFIHVAIPFVVLLMSFFANISISIGFFQENEELYSKAMNIFIEIQDISLFYVLGLQFIVYSWLCIRLFVRHRKNLEHFFSYSEGISLRWIRVFIAGMMLYFVVFLLSNNEFLFISGVDDSTYDIAHFSITIFFLYLIGTNGASQRNVYEQPALERLTTQEDVRVDRIPSFVLDETRKMEMAKQIEELLLTEKLFLNPSLTLDLLATRISSNRSYTSHVINESFGTNFYNLVNKYRIEEAVEMLQDGKHGNYSIEGIAGMCGFTSRSSFNSAFRKFTGKTPSDFRVIT